MLRRRERLKGSVRTMTKTLQFFLVLSILMDLFIEAWRSKGATYTVLGSMPRGCAKAFCTVSSSSPPSSSSNKRETRFRLIFETLQTYKELYGDLDVPYRYTVPNATAAHLWPDGSQSMKLGAIVSRIRTRNDFAGYRDDLEALGLQYEKRDGPFCITYDALKCYKEVYGDLLVKARFVVPSCPPWPKRCYGLKLGNRVDQIRNKGQYSSNGEYLQKLDDLGFVWETNRDKRGFGYIYGALQVYKLIHGDLNIPFNFIVPHEDPWPTEIGGMKLGMKVNHIRNRGDWAKYRHALDDLGFVWSAWRDKQFKEIFEALEEFKRSGQIPDKWESLDMRTSSRDEIELKLNNHERRKR